MTSAGTQDEPEAQDRVELVNRTSDPEPRSRKGRASRAVFRSHAVAHPHPHADYLDPSEAPRRRDRRILEPGAGLRAVASSPAAPEAARPGRRHGGPQEPPWREAASGRLRVVPDPGVALARS